jgi:hypothetical protein
MAIAAACSQCGFYLFKEEFFMNSSGLIALLLIGLLFVGRQALVDPAGVVLKSGSVQLRFVALS